jgi:hypothetical protein
MRHVSRVTNNERQRYRRPTITLDIAELERAQSRKAWAPL